MPRFPGFIGPSYTPYSVNVDAEMAMNLYPEVFNSEVGPNRAAMGFVPTKAALYSTPGYALFGTMPSGTSIRGAWANQDRLFVASDSVYEVFDDGTFSIRGVIGSGSGPVTFFSNHDELLIVDAPLVYLDAGATFNQVFFANTVDSATFDGTGLNDLTSGGDFTALGSVSLPVVVEIDGTGTPDTFKFSIDGGNTWFSTGVTITGASQPLDQGITVTFAATTGHALGDKWEFDANYGGPLVLATASFMDGFYLGNVWGSIYGALFYGVGLNDLSSGGTFTGSANLQFVVQIDATGTPDTFKWSDNNGVTWNATGVAITGGYQVLENGVTVRFLATTGHTLNDHWAFDALLGSQQFQISAPFDGSMWDPSQFGTKENYSDDISAVLVDHESLWLIGQESIEVWYDSGAADFPFQPIPGAFIDIGLAAVFSGGRIANTFLFLAGDSRGDRWVVQAQGYTPQRVSNHAVEQAMRAMSTVADAFCYTYTENGHSFYVLTFPTANQTWVYDLTVGQWHQRGEWNGTAFMRHIANCHAYIPSFGSGSHIIGDHSSANLYLSSLDIHSDNGNPLRWVRRSPHSNEEKKRLFYSQFVLDMERGVGIAAATGVVNTSGTAITWVSGATFQANWVGLTVNINGTNYTVAAVASGTAMTLNASAGTQSSVALTVAASGTVNTNGTAVSWVSGTKFSASWVGLGILINSVNYIVSAVGSSTALTLTEAAPILSGAAFTGGPAGNPQVALRYSDDGGHTWSNSHYASVGISAAYGQRSVWRRLGHARDRVFEVSGQDPVRIALVDAYVEASGGAT